MSRQGGHYSMSVIMFLTLMGLIFSFHGAYLMSKSILAQDFKNFFDGSFYDDGAVSFFNSVKNKLENLFGIFYLVFGVSSQAVTMFISENKLQFYLEWWQLILGFIFISITVLSRKIFVKYKMKLYMLEYLHANIEEYRSDSLQAGKMIDLLKNKYKENYPNKSEIALAESEEYSLEELFDAVGAKYDINKSELDNMELLHLLIQEKIF